MSSDQIRCLLRYTSCLNSAIVDFLWRTISSKSSITYVSGCQRRIYTLVSSVVVYSSSPLTKQNNIKYTIEQTSFLCKKRRLWKETLLAIIPYYTIKKTGDKFVTHTPIFLQKIHWRISAAPRRIDNGPGRCV